MLRLAAGNGNTRRGTIPLFLLFVEWGGQHNNCDSGLRASRSESLSAQRLRDMLCYFMKDAVLLGTAAGLLLGRADTGHPLSYKNFKCIHVPRRKRRSPGTRRHPFQSHVWSENRAVRLMPAWLQLIPGHAAHTLTNA